MSDFFMPNQKDNYFSKYENKNNTQNQSTQTDYWQNQSQKAIEQKQLQLDNRERYGVNVPDEYYDVFNKIISQAESPEQAQEEAYKIGSAVRYSQMMSIPLEEAYKNVDALNEAQFPDKADQKSRFEAISDMFTLGKNNVKLGELGQKLMKAHRENDTELAQSLMAEIDAINQQNQLMQDNAPRSWVMQALEAGAQSLPFTGAVAGAGILGNFIAPAVGTGASFAASSYLSAGTEYIDMLANGASPETARAVAMVSGGIQGIIEADLGITKGIVKGAARVAGKEVAESTAKKGLEEIGRKVFKRFHFGAGKKVLINYLENRGKDILGEGTEEFLQEITSIVGQEVAASLDGYDIPDDDFKHIVKQTTEAFRGGVLGALSMGFIPAGLNAAADVKSFKAIKDGAEVIESEEVFKEAVKDNPVFEGMSEQQKTETIHDVWERAQNRKEEAENLKAQKIAEGRDAGEGAEEAPAENEDGSTEANPVARDERGRLYTSDDVSTDENGNVTGGTFVFGDKTKSENNRYGYITYSTAENGDITIDTFKMTEGREGLRGEAFDEFAREHPNVKIDWNAIGSETQGFKNELIEANPSGSKNGLSYYSSDDLDNIAARKKVAEEVRKNIHNVKRNVDGSFTRTELSNKQVAAAVTLIESAARRMNMSLNDYVSKTFGNQIFGSREEFEQATLAQGENVNTKAGGMTQGVAQANWREVGQQVKAVIYAGENADFSTWAHEMAHVFQAQLDGELKTEAETAFNVVGGDWTRSTYTFADGRTMSSAEAFAYGFQDWLETGKAESEQMKNIFQKFAEFIADAYNKLRQHLNFTPEIESVFNKLLDGDDTIMSKALKAAQEQEGEYRANLKRQAEEKKAQQKIEAKKVKAQSEAEREEASEGTDFAEKAPTAEDLLNGIEEVENEEKQSGSNAIDDALENTNLTDEQKEEISEVLNDASATVVEKAEAATEAASSVYDEEYEIPNELFFQIAGEIGAQNLDDAEVQEGVSRMQNLAIAKQMETDGKDAKAIRLATGWEKGADGNWRWEIADDYHLRNIKATNAKLEKWENRLKKAKKEYEYLTGLTEEEKQKKQRMIADMVKHNAMPEGTTLESMIEDAENELHVAEMLMEYDTGLDVEAALKRLIERGIDPIDFWNDMGESFYLPQLIDNPELFKAYPQLKKVTIAFSRKDVAYHSGAYNEGENSITIFPQGARNYSVFRRTLIHEVQHAIQRIENFATGGSIRQFEPLMSKRELQEYKDILLGSGNIKSNKAQKLLEQINADINSSSKLMEFMKEIQAGNKTLDDWFEWLQSEQSKHPDYATYRQYYEQAMADFDEAEKLGKYETEKGEFITPEEAYRRLAGEVEARNVQTRMNFTPEERRNTLLAATEDVAPEDKIILFQEVYHGSPHNFEKFSTENIGTGEGAQAFGWGLYFTNQEGIARFYADKLANEPKRISLISKNEYLKSRKKSLRDVENKEKYEARIIKNINHFKKELKQAQKAGDESDIKFYEGLIDDSYKQLDDKERLSLVEAFKKDIANAEQEIKELKASMKNNRNLYTVEIPDEGYIKWDEEISKKQLQEIYDKLSDEQKERYNTIDWDNPEMAVVTGESLYDEMLPYILGYATGLTNYRHKNDKEISLFLKDVGYIGIDYPANSFSGYTTAGERNYVIFDEANANIKNHLLYQNVYHGSAADFDKFDTENYGLSGEGSMSFGYGTYLTDDEEIARDYAHRQAGAAKPEYSMAEVILQRVEQEGYTFEQAKQEAINRYSKWDQASAGNQAYMKARYDYARSIKSLDDVKETLSEIDKRKLYTVNIPDNGYISWNEPVTQEMLDRITPVYAEEMYNRWLNDSESQDGFIVYNDMQKKGIRKSFEDELQRELDADPTYDGAQLYKHIQRKLEYYDKENGAKLASKLLNKAGYAGIKYPAGTIHGNGNGAYNYVIFNDDDAQIVGKLLFQTQAELMDEARTFETWQEFMEYCELFHADDEVSPIPSDSDAQWYQSFWEQAMGVQTEQAKNEEAVDAKTKKEGTLPVAVDALFTTMIKSNQQMVDEFLQAVADIDAMDLDSEEWQQAENAEDAAQREKIEQLKDFINITLSDYNWQTALKRIQGGHEISEGLRKRLIGEMTDSFKARDFRALYAEVMNDEQYAVAEEDSITATLNKKLKKYHDIVKPSDDISRWSPERRKQLAEQLQNREIAAKIKNGSLKLDDELDAYIKSLNAQIKEKQKQFDELEAETKADYQRIADKEKRDLLKLHEQLLLARGKLKTRNQEVERKIAKGLKITDKYSRITQNLNADYDEIFRKYSDLRNSITINAEVQAALDRQEQVAGLRDDLNAKQKEKNLTAEVKKMRIQLVKRTMRRVPFNRIDYNNAKTVIAIQRMLEPNLLGGVNRFIGIDSPYLRGVISQLVTDSEYKEKIMSYLNHNAKASQAFADFKQKLTELKSIKDFDSWTAKDRKAAIRYLPKENWVRDLNLKELAKEREESIDLDIGMEEVKRTVYDEKTGEPKTYKDKEGNEHNVTETAFRLKYDEELGRLVQDAVGADMFDKIVNMPFSEWTTEDLEGLAQRIDEIYTEGRDLLAAKNEARKREAAAIRKRIEDAIKETGITFNDDDTPEERERKQKEIDKILGMSSDLKGTEAAKDKGLIAKITRLLHSYSDMNVMRFARMLDGQSEGENYRMLYRKEDDCYNAKQRSMASRAATVNKVMADNKITEGDLAKVVKVPQLGTEFTVDELLYFLAADKDYVEDEKKVQRGLMGLDANDDYAATSRNAVMFGNMMSDMMSQEEKESWLQLDKDLEEALKNDTLTQEQKEQQAAGTLDKKPGTTRYIMACHAKWEVVLGVANNYLSTHPEYKALMEAIEADYSSQYERMNEVSITEFNQPVHRVKAYVPLVRRESNGDTNEAQVKEDLLGASGIGKQWADKGMTQRRVQISPLNQKPVQTGLFRTWGDSIERTEHFIAYAPYVRQLNAIYKSRDAAYTRRFIESRYGKGAIEYLDSYINEVANPNAGRIRERGAEWLHVLRGKTAPAYLGWKASGIIKQGLTSPWPYMQFVNPAEYLSAAMKFTFNPEMREAISEKSIYMKMRRMDPVNDLIDEMADNAKSKLDRGWSKFSQMGMQGLEFIDWACVAPGWLACYEKKYNQLQNASNARYEAKMAELKERNIYAEVGTSEYLSPQQMEAEARKEITEDIETEAVRYADDCTRACQPSNRVTDLAPLFKNSSEAMKAFLQFQTSLNVIWQNIRYDLPYAVKQKEFKRIAGTVIGYVMAGIFMNSVMDGISGDDDDDETQALRNLIYYSTTQFTDAIPIMGSEITNAMDKIITGKRAYSQSGTDMTPSATKLLNALQKATNGDFKKAASLTAEGIGLFMGAPVSGVKEINKLLGKPLTNGDVDLLRGISDVYGIAGDILEE